MSTINSVSSFGLIATAGFFCIGLGAILTGSPAAADTSSSVSPFSFPFSYQRSELETPQGAQNLLNRLERAVRRECAPDIREANSQRALTARCVEETMRKSIPVFASDAVAEAFSTRVSG